MKEYRIRMLPAVPEDWGTVEKAMVDEFVWMKDYTPKTWAQAVFVLGDGFHVRMTCEEKNPRAVHTGFFSEVWKDSCMEFFAAYDNTKQDYVNVEMNSNGSCVIAVGPDRYARTRIDEIIDKPFPVKADVQPDFWQVTVHIPLADLARIYGMKPETFCAGYSFRGNFYKCGDETEIEHYGVWNPVLTEKPDYHRPEFFGTFVLTK